MDSIPHPETRLAIRPMQRKKVRDSDWKGGPMNQHAPYRRWLRWSRRTMRDTVNDTRGDLFHQADLWLAATKEPDAPAPGSEQTPTTARFDRLRASVDMANDGGKP